MHDIDFAALVDAVVKFFKSLDSYTIIGIAVFILALEYIKTRKGK